MNEDSKLDEAEYFLRRITETATRHPTVTRYELSACLSAARSALQYARKEAQDKDSQPWYDGAVSTADPVVEFLRDTRDIDIHHRPFSMRTNIRVGVAPAVLTLSSTRMTVVTGGDVVVEVPELPILLPPRQAQANLGELPTTTYRYQFKNWPRREDAIELCRRYLAEVKRIIADGRARGILML